MFEMKNKSAVILNPERSEWVSRSHVTGVEPVVNDRAKTKRYTAKKDLYGDFAYTQPLKMTEKALSFLRLRGAGKKQKKSSLILRKAKFQAIFKFVLSSASGGAGGGKYNRISAFVSMSVLLIRRSLEKFFKKNFRDDSSFYFGFAKVLALALIFTLITTAESRAECPATKNKWANTCYDKWNPGVADNCGNGCTYTYDNGKLTVTATKPDAVVPQGMFSPNYYESGKYPNVTDIEIAGEFKSISTHAFLNNRANIHGKDWVWVTNGSDGSNSFDGNGVSGTVIVKDGQTTLGEGPWFRTGFKGTLILPPTITSISAWALAGLSLGGNVKIYCGAENCEELFNNVDCEACGKKLGESMGTQCQNKKEQLLSSGKLLAYPDGCAKMWSTGCIKCKNENFKLNDGECDRLRWTPAEAAKVLRDDNTNEVTITFKK